MRFFTQKGLTLIEVLVSLVILSGGCVYVLRSLATAAEVQKRLEDHVRLYPVLTSKLAEAGMRVSAEKNPFADSRGVFTEGNQRYFWSVKNRFLNAAEAEAEASELGKSVLLSRRIEAGEDASKNGARLEIETYFKALVPENNR